MRRTLRTAMGSHPAQETASASPRHARAETAQEEWLLFAHIVKADRLKRHLAGPSAGCRKESVPQSGRNKNGRQSQKSGFSGNGNLAMIRNFCGELPWNWAFVERRDHEH